MAPVKFITRPPDANPVDGDFSNMNLDVGTAVLLMVASTHGQVKTPRSDTRFQKKKKKKTTTPAIHAPPHLSLSLSLFHPSLTKHTLARLVFRRPR